MDRNYDLSMMLNLFISSQNAQPYYFTILIARRPRAYKRYFYGILSITTYFRNAEEILCRMKWLIFIVTVLLVLIDARQGFRELPYNVTESIGSDITLRCTGFPSGTEHDLHSQWRSNTGALLGFRHPGVLPGHGGRYSYIRENPEELHLKIEKLELEDDGPFECQMVRRELGPIRATAYVNVIVPPDSVYFQNYQEGSVLELQEDATLNITCISSNAKPAPKMSWFMNGKLVTNQVASWEELNPNKTVVAFTTLTLRPTWVN